MVQKEQRQGDKLTSASGHESQQQHRRDAQRQHQIGDQLQRAGVEENQERADVVGEAGHQLAGLLAIEVGQRQALQLAVQAVGQPARTPG